MSNEPTYKLIPFPVWALTYTPVIPKAYWDVLSQEESIKNLWREFDRVRAYINYAYEELDKLAQELADQLDTAKEALAQAQETLDSAIAIKAEIEALRDECENIRQQAIQDLEAIKRATLEETQEKITQFTVDYGFMKQALLDDVQSIADEASDWKNQAKSEADRAQQIADGMQAFIDNTLARLAEVETLVNTYDARIKALEEYREANEYVVLHAGLHNTSQPLEITRDDITEYKTLRISYTVNGATNAPTVPMQISEIPLTWNTTGVAEARYISIGAQFYAAAGIAQLRTVTLMIRKDETDTTLRILGQRGGYINLYTTGNVTGEMREGEPDVNIFIRRIEGKKA